MSDSKPHSTRKPKKIDQDCLYDTIIIGAGMSGIAAAIRLAMFDRKVLLLEKHNVAGGLNSFYAKKGHLMDVGLHALTNFAKKGERNKPLLKILKQLRLSYSDLKLNEQSYSKIHSPKRTLSFTNDFSNFKDQLIQEFPTLKKGLENFLTFLETYNETDLQLDFESAREKLKSFFKNDVVSGAPNEQDEAEELVDMLMCPLLIYGSAWEHDMDFSQFVIMFKAIYIEGFSRPTGGVRTLIRLLMKRYKELGKKIIFNAEVSRISNFVQNAEELKQVTLASGEVLRAKHIISSIGIAETNQICGQRKEVTTRLIGKMTFTECIMYFDELPHKHKIDETIVFYNENPRYQYKCPDVLFDPSSAVICFPNNFQNLNSNDPVKAEFDQGIIRITMMANYDKWKNLYTAHPQQYQKEKDNVLNASLALIQKNYPQFNFKPTFSDVFTPTTIKRYTGHLGGCVYGSPNKIRDGKSEFKNVFICGTDQGFLGIIGALLSGISIANQYCLLPSSPEEKVSELVNVSLQENSL